MTTAIDYIYPKNSIDVDFDTMHDKMKPAVHIQIEDCKLALKKYIRVSASKTAGYSIVEFAKTRVIENLAELKRLCALPKQAKAPDGKLPLMTIKRLLEAGKLNINQMLDNYDMLERLHRLGLVSKDKHSSFCANVEQGCRNFVRQVPTNKPDGISKFLNQIIAKALKREYKIIGKCYVKRDGKMTATVYDIVGRKELFYILRCPVTGGTFGRTLENIHIPIYAHIETKIKTKIIW